MPLLELSDAQVFPLTQTTTGSLSVQQRLGQRISSQETAGTCCRWEPFRGSPFGPLPISSPWQLPHEIAGGALRAVLLSSIDVKPSDDPRPNQPRHSVGATITKNGSERFIGSNEPEKRSDPFF
jgi:hypothetical protein